MKALLRLADIDVNHRGETGFTPLLAASNEGHTGVVTELLRADGIEVNKANGDELATQSCT